MKAEFNAKTQRREDAKIHSQLSTQIPLNSLTWIGLVIFKPLIVAGMDATPLPFTDSPLAAMRVRVYFFVIDERK